jgi:phenylacetic acid degradation operon negative regulatory protein
VEGARAFVDYTRVLTSWRMLPYIDPGLPMSYLPRDWAGQPATELFFWFHDHLAEAAQQYVVDLCGDRQPG